MSNKSGHMFVRWRFEPRNSWFKVATTTSDSCDSERWPQKNSVPECIQQEQITRNNQPYSFCKFSKLLK